MPLLAVLRLLFVCNAFPGGVESCRSQDWHPVVLLLKPHRGGWRCNSSSPQAGWHSCALGKRLLPFRHHLGVGTSVFRDHITPPQPGPSWTVGQVRVCPRSAQGHAASLEASQSQSPDAGSGMQSTGFPRSARHGPCGVGQVPGWTVLPLSPDGRSSSAARALTPAPRGGGRSSMPSEGSSHHGPLHSSPVLYSRREEGSPYRITKTGWTGVRVGFSRGIPRRGILDRITRTPTKT